MLWLNLLLALAVAAPPVGPRVAIVDVGPAPGSAQARAAIEAALKQNLVGSRELRDALFGVGPAERTLADAHAALARAKTAFGALSCDAVEKALVDAERLLGSLPVGQTHAEIAEVYRYREACAQQAGDAPAVKRFAAIRAYLLDPSSGTRPPVVEVRIEPEPRDATVYIDGRESGRGRHELSVGPHLIDVEKSGFRKSHRLIEVTPPGPVQVAVTLGQLPVDPHRSLRASVLSLREGELRGRLGVLSEIAGRASVDRLVLVDVTGDDVEARLFDAEAGTLDPRTFKGNVAEGGVPGMAEFAAGPRPGTAGAGSGKKDEPGQKKESTWSRWYPWLLTGGLVAAAVIFAASTSESSQDLLIRARR